ncbi:MAG: Protoheme IX farnesyltransferase, mitochondrial [Chaenotheca gracillima]|nr:MAG: Protoheme IX farnesyltransferase, mitochondrial [Chaenotheca gracillima]
MRGRAPLSIGLDLLSSRNVCSRCLVRFHNASAARGGRRAYSSTYAPKNSIASTLPKGKAFKWNYFSANGSFNGAGQTKVPNSVGDGTLQEKTSINYGAEGVLPRGGKDTAHYAQPELSNSQSMTRLSHRRRSRQKNPAETVEQASSIANNPVIPPDASSRLSTLSSTFPIHSLRRLFSIYLSLSKPRLTFLIVLTTTTTYSLYPVPALLLPSTTISPSLSTLTLLFLTTGTALSSASANAFNMYLEPEYDGKMTRTRNRPLVRQLISSRGALAFAILSGLGGVSALYYGVNPTVAFLGALNIFLYAGVYTPMKRISVLNTWVGAIVGGIPPLMGWAAAAGQSASGNGGWQELLLGEESMGGWLLAALLFAWQFPHFNALSWTIREEYKAAGHRMLAWTNTRMNGRVALRYSILLFPICAGLTWAGVTDRGFLVTSSVVNAWMLREAWRFWKMEGQKGSARGLFWASVWHLPVVMVLAMAHKKGLWEGVWRSITGQTEDGEDALWDDEGDEE